MAARTAIITTTIRSSIRVNPACPLMFRKTIFTPQTHPSHKPEYDPPCTIDPYGRHRNERLGKVGSSSTHQSQELPPFSSLQHRLRARRMVGVPGIGEWSYCLPCPVSRYGDGHRGGWCMVDHTRACGWAGLV